MGTVARSPVFELSGGALCLDFANTARYHGKEREEIASYDDLLAWRNEVRFACEPMLPASAAYPDGAEDRRSAVTEVRQIFADS